MPSPQGESGGVAQCLPPKGGVSEESRGSSGRRVAGEANPINNTNFQKECNSILVPPLCKGGLGGVEECCTILEKWYKFRGLNWDTLDLAKSSLGTNLFSFFHKFRGLYHLRRAFFPCFPCLPCFPCPPFW